MDDKEDNSIGSQIYFTFAVNLFSSKQNITWHLISLTNLAAARKCPGIFV